MDSSSKGSETFIENDVAEVERKTEEHPLPEEETTDPHDPLTWSLVRKLTILFVVGIWILLGTANMIIIGPALEVVPMEFHSSFSSSTYLIGGPLLAYGVSSFFWVPLGNRYGVRLVFVVSTSIAGCMNCWAAKATSFGSLVAARTLASAFYAPPETLAPQMVGDVFYLKDRGKAMTWFGILQASGFAGGPLIGSFIIQNSDLGWRWVEWILAIITFATAVGLLLFFPETQYTRNFSATRRERSWKDNYRFWPVSGGGKPKDHSLAHGFMMIFPYFCHPVIILNLTFFSLCLVVNSYLLTTQSLTYLIVYPFSVGESGLTFIAPLIGTWLAMLFCGVLADRLFTRWTKKEGRKPKPEHRLPLLAFTGFIGIGGLLLFGICTQEYCHWVGPLFGSCFVSFCFIASLSISFAYLLDVYEARMDTVMVIYNGMKNLAAFGISYAIVPWNTSAGYTVPFVVMAVILFVAHLLMVLVYCRGEALRRWAAERFETAKDTHHGDAF
ncbi:uncharacterized protein Z518_04170 [Rhinocladiella mackenziei CBS 650.93]|uniref:Major facilitator superfamily (MFS) profile domain-containing protein n=1 Tax=Rhinocladiella mackenziei CBS 650.93 TaxID=1442369 RepID=A0A0D2ISQ2_9EURO|nr:uncharacterized protein Z518_04170 [Rhinocladiella mackenziei CBS 650.93]KIX06196.1 hypothetical protein Z518_04170 [Rhinocladiella mackenziei CBS 650.93]